MSADYDQAVRLFIASTCEEDDTLRVKATVLFQRFTDWADQYGCLMNQHDFGRAMNRLGFDRVKSYGYMNYIGLRLREAQKDEGEVEAEPGK